MNNENKLGSNLGQPIHYINGETTTIFNNVVRPRTTNFQATDNVAFELKYVPTDKLSSMYTDSSNYRQHIRSNNSLNNLKSSISKYTYLTPIIVYPLDLSDPDLGYTIIDGEKRVQIARLRGDSKLLAIVFYNVSSNSAQTMRVLLKEHVYEDPMQLLNYQKHLRDVTHDLDEADIEQFLNCETGTFEDIRSLQRRLKLHEHDNIHNDEQGIFEKVMNGDLKPKDGLDAFDAIEKKAKKKQEKLDKENAKLEKEQGLDTTSPAQKEEKASNTLGTVDDENSPKDLKDIDFDEDAIPEAKDKQDLFELGEQNYQQYVGDERRILPASLTKQIYARDNSQCAVCGYGGPHNLSASTVLEKHHIVDVQYGGTDNINNLVLLCPNCHRLVTNFLNGKATEYAPTPEDLKNNPQNWGAVVLGNMGRIARNEALRRIKKADAEVYHDTLIHKLTVGRALKKLQLSQIMPKEFNHDPYQTMVNSFFALQKQHVGFKIKNALINLDYQNNHQDLDTNEVKNITNINGVEINGETASEKQLTAPEDKKLPVAKKDINKEDNNEEEKHPVEEQKTNQIISVEDSDEKTDDKQQNDSHLVDKTENNSNSSNSSLPKTSD